MKLSNLLLSVARIIYPPITPGEGYIKPKNLTKIFKKVYHLPLKTTAINNLIRKYSFMRSYLNIIPIIFLMLFNALFSIFHAESLVKMSNSPWFSRIFTLQSSSWFCFNYSFWLFLRCIWKKITTRVRDFYNHWVLKFLKIFLFLFPIFKID